MEWADEPPPPILLYRVSYEQDKMVQGNFANGDHFIDTPGISLSAQRAIFGVWLLHIYVAICIRFIFHSQVGKHITSGKGGVSL